MRTRRNVRDDMMREVEKKGLKSDVESAAWLNLFSMCACISSLVSTLMYYRLRSD